MIPSTDLARLAVRRIIFHDVPNRPKKTEETPVLADLETKIDGKHAQMLARRMVQVLGSKSAYPVVFATGTGSKVPDEVRAYTKAEELPDTFVEMSKRVAIFLFDQHNGATSRGLLCVADVSVGNRRGLALLKLEREEGAELTPRLQGGKRVFDMSVLDNLILTEGTRLFKTGLFIRTGPGDDDFEAAACDSQWNVTTSGDVARFWIRFLGCSFTEEPRVSTQKWFEATVRFANESVTDPVIKNDLYEHLYSELKSNRTTIAPRKFIEDCIPTRYRQIYADFLKETGIALHAFSKDTADIKNRLRRRSFHTSKGVSVTVPEEEARIVEIGREKIVVHDEVTTIDRS
jgi:37-kD nucleoid-associated bacterial protein